MIPLARRLVQRNGIPLVLSPKASIESMSNLESFFFLNRNKQKEGGPVWNRQLHAPSHSNRMRGKCSNENATFVLGFGVILESWISEAPTKVLLQPTTGSVQVMKHVVSQLRRSTYIKEKRIYQLLGSPVDHGSDGLIGFLLGLVEVFMVGDL